MKPTAPARSSHSLTATPLTQRAWRRSGYRGLGRTRFVPIEFAQELERLLTVRNYPQRNP